MRGLTRLGMAALLLMLVGGAAAAQRGGPGMAPGGFALFDMMDQDFDGFAGQLALTDTQRTELQEMLSAFKEGHGEPLGRMAAMVQELRERRQQGRPEPGAMQAIADKHGNPQQELQPALHEFQQGVEAALSEEQQAILVRMVRARMGRR